MSQLPIHFDVFDFDKPQFKQICSGASISASFDTKLCRVTISI